jgi:hypothetical protein
MPRQDSQELATRQQWNRIKVNVWPAVGRIVFVLSVVFCLTAGIATTIRALGYSLVYGPRLQLDTNMVDLGRVEPGATVPIVVRVRNIGHGKLRLESIRSGCNSCVKVISWPKDAIGPGEEAAISMEINADSGSGTIEKRVVVISNDPSARASVILCKWSL